MTQKFTSSHKWRKLMTYDSEEMSDIFTSVLQTEKKYLISVKMKIN